MMVRKLGVAAALSVVLLSGAQAAPITYDVNFKFPGFDPSNTPARLDLTVTGKITTDGKIGILQDSDISNVNIILDGRVLNSIQISNPFDDESFVASSNGALTFSFVSTSNSNSPLDADRLIFKSPDSRQYIQIYSGSGFNFSYVNDFDSEIGAYSNELSQGTILTIGTATVSAVPLPASAPLFGAALVAFGVAGFGVTRGRAKARAAG